MIKIRINDKKGNFISDCILDKDEFNNFIVLEKNNISNIFGDLEQSKFGFIDTIDIDLR